jgi:surface protein
MQRMIRYSKFNQSIDSWDVSQVENMDGMFYYALKFNQPIDSWDVSQVKTTQGMFLGAKAFNKPIDSWDVSQVENMNGMFFSAGDFNQCLSTWAEKTTDTVYTNNMLAGTDCPKGIDSPNATIGPWC